MKGGPGELARSASPAKAAYRKHPLPRRFRQTRRVGESPRVAEEAQLPLWSQCAVLVSDLARQDVRSSPYLRLLEGQGMVIGWPPCRVALQLTAPASDHGVRKSAGVGHETLALAEGKFVATAEVEDVANIERAPGRNHPGFRSRERPEHGSRPLLGLRCRR